MDHEEATESIKANKSKQPYQKNHHGNNTQ